VAQGLVIGLASALPCDLGKAASVSITAPARFFASHLASTMLGANVPLFIEAVDGNAVVAVGDPLTHQRGAQPREDRQARNGPVRGTLVGGGPQPGNAAHRHGSTQLKSHSCATRGSVRRLQRILTQAVAIRAVLSGARAAG
jgi:hypothetical protein